MTTLRERLDAGRSVEPLADHITQRLAERWEPVLAERRATLEEMFEKHADVAYGTYSRRLMEPIRGDLDELAAGGYTVEPAYPGSFRDSVEPMTAPEERVRTFWTVVSRDGEPLGALLLRFFHDHSRFRVPRAPQVRALEETSPAAIRSVIDRL
jgi:hypothetical protein